MRNAGQHNALLCGIRAARHELTLTLDDDLQNPPEEISKLIRALTGDVDVVYGAPRVEVHGVWRDLASLVTKIVVLTVPAYMSLWGRFDEESHHCRRYERDQLRARLPDAGFTIEYLTPFMVALYPMARIGRSLSDAGNRPRRRLNMTQTFAVLPDLTVTPVVNELAGFLLRQEARLLRRRIKLPLGTSLLAVARASLVSRT
jgi:glycosyltransferase involved in cell wall biosynthesis